MNKDFFKKVRILDGGMGSLPEPLRRKIERSLSLWLSCECPECPPDAAIAYSDDHNI